jgi:hypothetical protein
MSSRGEILAKLACEIVERERANESDSDSFGDNSDADENFNPSSDSEENNSDDEEEDEVHVTNSSFANDCWYDIDVTCQDIPQQSSSPQEFQDYANVDAELKVDGNIKTILDCYQLFVNDDVLNLIVSETNDFAQQKLSKQNQGQKSRISKWQPTNNEEIRKFFSIILTMGLVREPKMDLYWSKDSMFHNSFIASIMPRDRFLLLLNCIHFSNNEDSSQLNDRTRKIKPLLKLLLDNFKTVLTPGRHLVIDESMVPYRGRLIFRQFIPNKSHKYGMKLYKLCTVNGYTCDIILYSGKGTTDGETSHSESIVLKLLESVEHAEGRTVFADNFYSSVPLAEKLHERKTRYCGTLRGNRRGLPKEIVQKKLKKGEICGKQKNCVKVIKWHDKRSVLMLTTVPTHDASLADTGKLTRTGEAIKKPECVISYNKAKKGVDYSDQMSSYHSVLRKGVKWYRKLAFELLFGTTVVNSWIVYNLISEKKISITNFRSMLAKALADKETCENGKTGRKRSAHSFVRPEGAGKKT